MKIADIDIRDAFFDELYTIAKNDPNVIFLTADMGAYSLVMFKEELSSQYINLGAAEQNMVSIAAGLALGGKIVFIYSIIPFVTLHCYEQIKIDLCCMNLPVTIIGAGPGFTSGSDGPTHNATQDIAVMRVLPEMTILNPSDPVMIQAFANFAYRIPGPKYIRMDKGKFPVIYDGKNNDFSDGLTELRKGRDLTIIATGIMVHWALKAADELNIRSLSTGVIDLYRLKPLNVEKLLKIINTSKYVVTLEENSIIGGIGSAVSEIFSDTGRNVLLKRLAVPDQHCFKTGDRESLNAFYNLDTPGIVKAILDWIRHK